MSCQEFDHWLYVHLALSDVNVALLLWCMGVLMRATVQVLNPFALLLGYEPTTRYGWQYSMLTTLVLCIAINVVSMFSHSRLWTMIMDVEECLRKKSRCDKHFARFRNFTDLQVLNLIIALALLTQGIVFMAQASTIGDFTATNYAILARAYFDDISNISKKDRYEVVSVLNDLHYKVHCCGVSDNNRVDSRNDPLKIWYRITIEKRRQLPASCCRHYDTNARCQLEWTPLLKPRTDSDDEQFAALELRLATPNGVYLNECSGALHSYVFWQVHVPLCVPMIVVGFLHIITLGVSRVAVNAARTRLDAMHLAISLDPEESLSSGSNEEASEATQLAPSNTQARTNTTISAHV